MQRQQLVALLDQAEKHVSLGRRHISRQRQLIDDLAYYGDRSDTARDLLRTFENLQKQHLADRDRLAGMLAQSE